MITAAVDSGDDATTILSSAELPSAGVGPSPADATRPDRITW